MSMRVKELINFLKKMPQTKEVYYSDNNQFLDIDNVTNQSDRQAPQGGLVILGFDMELRGDFIKRPKGHWSTFFIDVHSIIYNLDWREYKWNRTICT